MIYLLVLSEREDINNSRAERNGIQRLKGSWYCLQLPVLVVSCAISSIGIFGEDSNVTYCKTRE